MSENARNTDPETSHAAAARISTTVRQRVTAIFVNFIHGLTDEELQRVYEMSHGLKDIAPDSPRKRRSDLTRDGFLKDSGLRRSSIYELDQIVWVMA